jgi:hypothetical protein
VKRIPELKGLQRAPDQEKLPAILKKTAANVDGFFENIVDLIAQEKITQERLSRTGRVTASEDVRDNYLILRSSNQGRTDVREYRMDARGNPLGQIGIHNGFLVTFGFAFMCNYFSSGFQQESTFRYLGEEKIAERDTYVVAFAQKPAEATLVVSLAGKGDTSVRLLMQGIAWVDKSNFQITKMRTDLLAPRPDVELARQTTELSLSQVQLLDVASPLWLPKDVKVYLQFKTIDRVHNQFYEQSFYEENYRNEHHYTDYRRYRVSSKMLVPQ